MTLQTIASWVVASAVAVTSGVAAAQSDVPDLTGTWQIDATAVGHPNGETEQGATTRLLFEGTFEFVVDWQDGPRFSGIDVVEEVDASLAPRPNEQFSGVISPDNTMAYIVDNNGTFDCTIVSPDRLECIYRHIEPEASIVAINIWTRHD
jgi:hypothetical protein